MEKEQIFGDATGTLENPEVISRSKRHQLQFGLGEGCWKYQKALKHLVKKVHRSNAA